MSVTVDNGRKSFIAEIDLSAKRYFIMKYGTSANEITLAAAASDLLVGTLNNKPKADEGANLTLRSGEVTGKVIAGGSISKGDQLTSDSNGKAIATTTAGNLLIGEALEDASSGDLFEYDPRGGFYAIT